MKSQSPTRKERVFSLMRSLRWTPGYRITDPDVGGSEGLRRLRELRDEGYEFKMRKMTNSDAYEYRLVSTRPMATV